MAKKTLLVSDLRGKRSLRARAQLSRSSSPTLGKEHVLDVTDAEAEELGQSGRKQARRGRRPKLPLARRLRRVVWLISLGQS